MHAPISDARLWIIWAGTSRVSCCRGLPRPAPGSLRAASGTTGRGIRDGYSTKRFGERNVERDGHRHGQRNRYWLGNRNRRPAERDGGPPSDWTGAVGHVPEPFAVAYGVRLEVVHDVGW